MNASKPFDGFHLDNYRILNEQIDAERRLERNVAVSKRVRLLPLDPQSTTLQLEREAHFVRRLEEPRSEFAMHLDPAADNLVRQLVEAIGIGSHPWAAMQIADRWHGSKFSK